MALLAGWVVITDIFFRIPLRYLDAVAEQAGKLAAPSMDPVMLPEELAQLQGELERVRLRALQSAQEARDEEQRKNDMIVYLAHDLKTPLTSVIGYLTILRDEQELPAALRARYTGISLEKALRLEELISEFFEITRFSLTHLTLEPQPVNLTRMLEQTADESIPLLADRGLYWQLDLEPGVELVCDPEKLSRVFDNLIRNAVCYSYPDTAVRLEMHRADGEVVLQFCNRGRAIPPEKRERLFEPFFRLDAARSTASGGAGLGLAIAKEIVELLGGSFQVCGEGEEVCFVLRLPADR